MVPKKNHIYDRVSMTGYDFFPSYPLVGMLSVKKNIQDVFPYRCLPDIAQGFINLQHFKKKSNYNHFSFYRLQVDRTPDG